MDILGYAIQVFSLVVFTGVVWSLFRKVRFGYPLEIIPGPRRQSWFEGHLWQLLSKSSGLQFQEHLYSTYGNIVRVATPLGGTGLFVSDPKVMHHVFVKDQEIFKETSAFLAGNCTVLGPGLLATDGDQHRKQRKMLNPVFSINHMRHMIPIFTQLSSKLTDTMCRLVSDGPKEIEVLEWLTRFALELIGQSGFGYSFDPLTEEYKEHPYATSSKLLIPVAMKLTFSRFLVLPFVRKWNLGGKRLQAFVVDHLSWGNWRRMRDIVDVVHKTSLEIYGSKKQALEKGEQALLNQVGQGKDILTILTRANMDTSEEDRLPDEEIIAQISTFTFAATDTTSSALCRLFYLLSKHQDVQDRLRNEILEARANYETDLNYDQLNSLPYLDAVCRETLRLYPPVPIAQRDTSRDTIVQLSKPIRGTKGQMLNEVLIPKGTRIFASLMGCNRNRELWGPDADEWKPERWLTPLPDAITDAHIPGIYSNLMTFIGGSRACIGFKFSQFEMKAVLFALLERLKFRLSDKEIMWGMSTIVTPSVDLENLRPELPLVVERI